VRARRDQPEVDRHADRDEEQAEQQALERGDVGLERVPVLGAREQDAREKGAERHRESRERHQLRDAEDQQQRERGEHLADVRFCDQPQDGPREEPTDHDHRNDRPERLRPVDPGIARVGSARRQERDERDERDGGDVLEEQYRERAAPHRRVEQIALCHRLHRDCGGRHRDREPRDDRRHPPEARGREARGEQGATQKGDDLPPKTPAHAGERAMSS
jgi:hypothetical protein